MLLVKTKIGPSKISGIGLFADQFIPKGTVIWEMTKDVDVKIDENKYNSYRTEPFFEQMDKYVFKSQINPHYILCSDDARFMNHSSTPNTLNTADDEGVTIAVDDIQPGDELTCDYSSFDGDFENYSFS